MKRKNTSKKTKPSLHTLNMRLRDFYAAAKSKIGNREQLLDKARLPITIILLIVIAVFGTKYYLEQNNKSCVSNANWEKTQDELLAKLTESENQKNILQQELNNKSNNPSTTQASEEPVGKININTASAAELDKLPGIGPVYSQRIVDYRKSIGVFKKIEQIMDVKGIGEKTFEKFKGQISI